MPPSKKKAPSASSSRNANATAKAKGTPYNRNAKGTSAAGTNKKAHTTMPSKPTQARNKHQNMNLTSELDSLLGDLNSQLQRKKTKRDVRSTDPSGVSESEKKLNEAQAKHESLQQDMMNALDGISSLGN
ncbi:hypothetical protein BGX29_007157 [Mortierella sp. GBA35]|nr:hypothetical protein BGX23_007316 [Mortierella sp. AD031]KAF9099385.1 hypothetical protein BGX29_007157 [Mortierella sp. GBA35]KAG0215997.1 hypothetical protein BGX33_000580 [Mortierella sp. NVP41]